MKFFLQGLLLISCFVIQCSENTFFEEYEKKITQRNKQFKASILATLKKITHQEKEPISCAQNKPFLNFFSCCKRPVNIIKYEKMQTTLQQYPLSNLADSLDLDDFADSCPGCNFQDLITPEEKETFTRDLTQECEIYFNSFKNSILLNGYGQPIRYDKLAETAAVTTLVDHVFELHQQKYNVITQNNVLCHLHQTNANQ